MSNQTDKKQKNWLYTLNNPVSDPSFDAVYQVFGRERAPTTGTPHLQGFVVFNKNLRLAAVCKLLPLAHWIPAKGSAAQNRTYCIKDGDFIESGVIPSDKRKRGEDEKERWTLAVKACKEGRLDDVPDDILMRYYRTCKELKKDFMKPPPDLPVIKNFWYFGDSGTGKSRKAREQFPGSYLKMCNKWWDGYQGEETVIIDDFDLVHKPLGHHLKIWGDHYAFIAETKNGAIMIRPKTIIVTSNYLIDDIWLNENGTIGPLERRYTTIKF